MFHKLLHYYIINECTIRVQNILFQNILQCDSKKEVNQIENYVSMMKLYTLGTCKHRVGTGV